jgi:hypothetical protein
MNPRNNPPDRQDDNALDADKLVNERGSERDRAKRPQAADKGPGSASADTGMTSDGGHVDEQPSDGEPN